MKVVVFLFSVTLFLLTAFSYAFVDGNFFPLKNFYTGFATERRDIVTVLYILFIITIYGLYITLLRLAQKNKITFGQVRKLILISVLLLFFAYPAMLSFDIFNYLTTAKVTFFYKENPYIVMPIEFTSDVNFMFTRAANKLALYGPSWILLTFIPYFLGAQNILTTVFAFKGLVVSFYLATAWLIWKMSKSIHSLVFFMLNPLVLIETLVSSHNDIVMMFFALFSFYLIKQRRLILAVFMFISSILIKFAVIILLPLFIFSLYSSFRKKELNLDKIYVISAFLMTFMVVVSPLREELYPWYIIWVLIFIALIPKHKFLQTFSIALSFGALLRYVPFLYTGSYFGITPFIRETVTIFPLIVVTFFFLYKKLVIRSIN